MTWTLYAVALISYIPLSAASTGSNVQFYLYYIYILLVVTSDPLELSNDSRHAAIDRNSHFSSLNWIYYPGFSQDAKSWPRSSALLSQQRCSQPRSGVLRQHNSTHSLSIFDFPWLYYFITLFHLLAISATLLIHQSLQGVLCIGPG